MNIQSFGWNDFFAEHFTAYDQDKYTVGRIFKEHQNSYQVYTEYGELFAEVSGSLRFKAKERGDFPAVGDWVVITMRIAEEKATIHDILPRFSKLSRKVAGSTWEEQIIAANINTVFIVSSLNDDFNLRRLERYLVVVWESGSTPVIVLSKADLCEDIERKLERLDAVAYGVPVHVISAIEEGCSALKAYFEEGETVALIGSSGVGKSTLINRLLEGEIQKVNTIRSDDGKGRHTTTHRELFLLPSGGLIIDTPGMRELQLWGINEQMEHGFQDIEERSEQCKFRDCTHTTEPQCAVIQAVKHGDLEQKRVANYHKMLREQKYFERKMEKKTQKINNTKGKR